MAADRAIPFGTLIKVPGYAADAAVPVLDRGGKIRGSRIDVFFLTHQAALNWGRQTLTVEVITAEEQAMGHLGGMLLPARPGTCSECAVDHPVNSPHNRDSLFYQYRFFDLHGRWPTWNDAMAHCDEPMRDYWSVMLIETGVSLDEAGHEPVAPKAHA